MTNAANCPICGQPNNCQRATTATYKGSCWCFHVEIPKRLLDQVPEEDKNRACICCDCIRKHQAAQT